MEILDHSYTNLLLLQLLAAVSSAAAVWTGAKPCVWTASTRSTVRAVTGVAEPSPGGTRQATSGAFAPALSSGAPETLNIARP
jgi:hypothetical protein